ncbi:MAG TPA: hypothetical protein VJ963_02555 [Bacteroidales bacterium]|nr:hypothetical protein [Bacteroidales bacterium]
MQNLNLNIAGYRICFLSAEKGPDLIPSERFRRNICSTCESDVQVTVHNGLIKLPGTALRVFHAPFVEEINGVQLRHKANFWSIWKYRKDLYILTVFPLMDTEKNAVLKFSPDNKNWDLWIEGSNKEIDPFEYPLDGLILYYLTVMHGDIMIHASGVNHSGFGYIFSGVSGKGKSTMASLWEEKGAKVIHDDRLIIRKKKNGYMMYNTPVYNNDTPAESVLNRIFIIEHGPENRITPLRGALAISMIMSNCIQHNWDHDIVEGLLESVTDMCNSIPVAKLSFKPDKRVITLIIKDEQR